MRRSRARGAISVVIAIAVLLALTGAPVSAQTLQRTWSAKMGWNGGNGWITMRAYTSGVGTISFALKGLRTSATYGVEIRKGSCSSPSTLMARLPAIHTANGAVSQINIIDSGTMNWIWLAARSPSFIIRVVSGAAVSCGGFSFAHATRVWVSGIGIDLPVIRGPSGYPPCKVAMYSAMVAQPREPGITFIFAHARTGMFLPLLTSWRNNRGSSLIGRTVKVWTSDSRVVYYRINRVRVTQDAMAGATTLSTERLWLQTSTGPNYTYPKLVVKAQRISTVASTYAAAHPTARPVTCG